jgi:DNA repair exonuclease SbcCD ATPase subunit
MAEGQLMDKEQEDSKRRIEQLEKEKAELAEKSKGLADIIEQISTEKPDTEAIQAAIGNHLKDMGEKFDAKLKKLEDNVSSSTKDKEESKKQVVALMKEKVDPKLGEISDKLKELEKLKDLGDKIAQINERLSSPLYQPKQPGAVSQGLASFGEQVDFESELNEVRKAVESATNSLNIMSKKVEYRLSSAEDKLKELEKLKHLEDMYREISDKLGTENVQRLKKLIFSSEELVEEIVPELVNRKMRKRVEPIVNSLKSNRDFSVELEKRLNLLDGEMRELKKFRDTIAELRMEKDKLYKRYAEEEARFMQGLEVLKMNIRKKMEKTMERYEQQLAKMQDFASPKTLQAGVKDVVLDLFENRMQDIEKHLMMLDEKARALVEKDKETVGMVESLEAPENLRKWIGEKTQDIERKFFYDIQGLKKETVKNADHAVALREKHKTLESVINEVSRKLSDQSASVARVIDMKDTFAKRTENLGAAIRSLEAKIAGDKERTIALERDMKEVDSKLEHVSDNIALLDKAISDMRLLKEKLSETDASVKVLQKRLPERDNLAATVKRLEAEMESLREAQSRMEAQAAADRVQYDTIIRQSVTEKKQVEERIKKERLKINELLGELKG